jgi:hypothetical protein
MAVPGQRLAWRIVLRATPVLLGFATVPAQPAVAQSRAPAATDVPAGSELENYLRLLQVAGKAAHYPWSIRGFSGREIERLLPADTVAAPWRLSAERLRSRLTLGSIEVNTVFNSAFPHGSNDGAVWAGRGLTASASVAVRMRAGPLSLTLAPVGFVTTNGEFPLLENGETGSLAYNDGLVPRYIDRPQRFGDGAYGRGDVGASEIRLDTRAVTLGFGTAPMTWGPAVEHPFLLSTNAPGFPHAFLGTGSPVNIGIGTLHARVVWGKLSQSSYSPVVGSDRFVADTQPGRDRLMTGLALVVAPRIAPNLELGVARFLHLPYPAEGIDGKFFRRTLPTFLKKNVTGEAIEDVADENDLASVFARWVFPAAGFELYAEHGHDDWFHDLRDLTQEPDHYRAYVIGFQKVLRSTPDRMSSIRGEIINYQMPPLGRDRPGQGFVYTHSALPQGHTHRGQLLGSNAGVGAAAAGVLAWDRYGPAGRTTLTWRRIVRAHAGTFHEDGVEISRRTDVIHALGVERSRGNASLRYTLGADLLGNINRNFSSDVVSVNARAGIQWTP